MRGRACFLLLLLFVQDTSAIMANVDLVKTVSEGTCQRGLDKHQATFHSIADKIPLISHMSKVTSHPLFRSSRLSSILTGLASRALSYHTERALDLEQSLTPSADSNQSLGESEEEEEALSLTLPIPVPVDSVKFGDESGVGVVEGGAAQAPMLSDAVSDVLDKSSDDAVSAKDVGVGDEPITLNEEPMTLNDEPITQKEKEEVGQVVLGEEEGVARHLEEARTDQEIEAMMAELRQKSTSKAASARRGTRNEAAPDPFGSDRTASKSQRLAPVVEDAEGLISSRPSTPRSSSPKRETVVSSRPAPVQRSGSDRAVAGSGSGSGRKDAKEKVTLVKPGTTGLTKAGVANKASSRGGADKEDKTNDAFPWHHYGGGGEELHDDPIEFIRLKRREVTKKREQSGLFGTDGDPAAKHGSDENDEDGVMKMVMGEKEEADLLAAQDMFMEEEKALSLIPEERLFRPVNYYGHINHPRTMEAEKGMYEDLDNEVTFRPGIFDYRFWDNVFTRPTLRRLILVLVVVFLSSIVSMFLCMTNNIKSYDHEIEH